MRLGEWQCHSSKQGMRNRIRLGIVGWSESWVYFNCVEIQEPRKTQSFAKRKNKSDSILDWFIYYINLCILLLLLLVKNRMIFPFLLNICANCCLLRFQVSSVYYFKSSTYINSSNSHSSPIKHWITAPFCR